LLDKDLFKSIKDFLELIKQKQKYLKDNIINNNEVDLNNEIKYNEKRLDELDINFIFPNKNLTELKENGSEIILSMDNIEEYIGLIYDKFFGNDMKIIIEAFKEGYNSVFNIDNLSCFSSVELEEIILGNDSSPWDYDNLYENIKTNHGYDKDSLIYHYLIQILSNFTSLEKKKFLIFATGSPRLPLGGNYSFLIFYYKYRV
jgi:E3 ubiquitin-protein ligase TRIP12